VQNKRLFVDFGALDNTAVNDVDGIRTDLDGRVYIVRNGGWQVAVFSKEGELLQRIHTNMRSVAATVLLWSTSCLCSSSASSTLLADQLLMQECFSHQNFNLSYSTCASVNRSYYLVVTLVAECSVLEHALA
jgi:SMP-30/Gluconolactonase/LRE-like region